METPAIPTEDWLSDTPYLVGEDSVSQIRFGKAYRRSITTKDRALAVASEIKADAQEILEPFAQAMRTDLVAESNRLEGYDWTRPAVRDVVELHHELITAELHHFMEAMRRDPHLMEALGLYRAYVIADGWVASETRPREYEIRGLHGVIVAGTTDAGRYKWKLNRIEGSAHIPVDPFQVARAMSDLTHWWLRGSPDPVLDATVVHAWLTHIHPFEDGNGRLARLLANLALSRAGYPPLTISSSTDRGQYLDALAASDDGDILPLYDLFATVTKRAVKTMSRPGYARELVEERLLKTTRQRYDAWERVATQFTNGLRRNIRDRGWNAFFQGRPDVSAFRLLCDRSAAGNGWFLKVIDNARRERYLLFWGYNSNDSMDLLGREWRPLPSIFNSVRSDDPTAIHPYRALWNGAELGLPDEIILLLPTSRKPVLIRKGTEIRERTVEEAATELAMSITVT
jgi:Fic family protein